MKTLKFRISPDIVRKANTRFIVNGSNSILKPHLGGLEARYYINGVEVVREISSDKVKEAYRKSLSQYAKKL